MSEREKMEAQTAAFQNTDDADPALVLAAVRHCASLWVGEARLLGNVRAKDIVRAIDAIRSAAAPAPGYAQGFEACREAATKRARDMSTKEFDDADLIAKAITALPAPAGVEDWQPIETAPKDGTPFLAWEGKDRGPFKCWWHTRWTEPEAYWMDHNDSEPNPTHWKPFSAPPTILAKPAQEGQGS